MFGRAAMGEVVKRGLLRDRIEVWRGGRLLLHDAIRLEGQVAETLRRPAVAKGARAMTTLVHVAPDAGAKVEAVRTASIAASAWDGMLVARILAENDTAPRQSVVDVLPVLRGERTLPRAWMC